MIGPVWVFRAPPQWPQPPPGWFPPPGWQPPPDWPPAAPDWQFWVLAPPAYGPTGQPVYPMSPIPPPAPPIEPLRFPVEVPPATRRSLVLETWVMAVAFLWPAITGAAVVFAESAAGRHQTRFPVLVSGSPIFNLVFGIIAYLPTAAVVPVALYLLARSGQSPRWLGLGAPRFIADVLPGLGLAAAAFGVEIFIAICLSPFLVHTSKLQNQLPIGHVPAYYLAYAVVISLVTAVAEEVLMNGFLVTRLTQLGWSRDKTLLLCMALRTSYHVYYGIGFIFTIPFSFFVTRSFQKHRRLNRTISAHFLFDATLFFLALTSGLWKLSFVVPFCGLALVSAAFSRSPAPDVPG